MAEETSSSAVKSYPNKFWNPYRYYAMGAYVMMYNAIKNNPIEYGIGQQNFDIQINQYIKDHFDELSAKLGFKFQTYQSITGVPMPSKYSAFSLPYVKEDFLNDFDALVGEARRLSAGGYGSTNEKGATTMMSVDSLQKFLTQDKEKDAKGYYENIRSVYKYKSENVDPKTGKPKSGEFAVAARNAQMEYGDKKRLLRRTGWQLFGRGLLSVLGIGVTAVSVVSVLSGGGLALGAIFGSTLRATGLGRVFAGLVGSIGGGLFTKKVGTKFFEKWGERKNYREDFRDFMDGVGKYATKDGKPQGFKGSMERYKCAGALLNYMNAAGKYWKELWGFGPEGKPTLTYEGLLDKLENKEDKKYLQEKNNPYIKRYGDLYLDNFSLKKLAEEGIFAKFVNSDTKDVGFQNIYNARAKIVNEYNMYKKSLPETIKLYNNFFDSSDPEIVKQRNDIEVVVGKLGDFEKLKGDFEAAGDSGNSAYSAISDKFSYQLENTMKHMLLNGNFSDDMLTQIDNALNKENVKNALEKGPTDVNVKYIKSVNKFISIESKAGKEIADGLGVSVKNQLTMDKKHIVAGCTEMKNGVSTDDPAYADVESIASDIGTLSTKQDAATISTNIDALTVSDEVKNYLHYMLKKKTEMTKRNSVDIYKNINDALAGSGVSVSMSGPEGTLIQKIASMRSASDSISVRNLIAKSSVSDQIKDELFRVLDDQTNSLKTFERRDVKSKVVSVLEGTSNGDIEAWAGKISEIDEKITSEVVERDYHYQIRGVRNKDIKNYLELRLKDQLTKVFVNYIRSSDTFVVNEENPMTTMNEIRTFMRKVSAFATPDPKNGVPAHIDEWQKQQCLDAFSEKVGNVFETVLKNLEEGFLNDTSSKKETVRKLLFEPMQNSGFKEYFDAKTSFSIQLEKRLNRIYKAESYHELMKGIGTTGYNHTIVDADAEYNKKMLKIYFSENRSAGNSLVKMMQRLRTLAGPSFVPNAMELKDDPERLSAIPPFVGDRFDVTQNTTTQVIYDGDTPGTVTNIDYSKSFVYNMIRTLNSTEFEALSPKDKIATIYVMRKYVVAMFRSQLAQFKMKFKNQVDNHEFINKHEDQITVYMGENWKKLAGLMDDIRNEAASELSPEEEVYADNVSFVQYITKMCDSTQFLNQIQEDKTMGM